MCTQAAQTTKHLSKTQPGDTVIVPMGMIFPAAIQVEATYCDLHGQMIASGHQVQRPGCTDWPTGGDVCLGWVNPPTNGEWIDGHWFPFEKE